MTRNLWPDLGLPVLGVRELLPSTRIWNLGGRYGGALLFSKEGRSLGVLTSGRCLNFGFVTCPRMRVCASTVEDLCQRCHYIDRFSR